MEFDFNENECQLFYNSQNIGKCFEMKSKVKLKTQSNRNKCINNKDVLIFGFGYDKPKLAVNVHNQGWGTGMSRGGRMRMNYNRNNNAYTNKNNGMNDYLNNRVKIMAKCSIFNKHNPKAKDDDDDMFQMIGKENDLKSNVLSLNHLVFNTAIQNKKCVFANKLNQQIVDVD